MHIVIASVNIYITRSWDQLNINIVIVSFQLRFNFNIIFNILVSY